jgi:hypothetical protein
MFRKVLIASAATVALGAAALAPTAASAGWHGHRGGIGIGFFGVGDGYYGGDCYLVQRWVRTPYGKRLQTFRVCS